jgi:hypothetical protein
VKKWLAINLCINNCLSLFLTLSTFYLLIVDVEVYFCAGSQWRTHVHTHTHTVSRTLLDEGSACRRVYYLTTPPSGFEPTIPARERPQMYKQFISKTGESAYKLGKSSSQKWYPKIPARCIRFGMLSTKKSELHSKASTTVKTMCNAVASSQTAQGCRDVCAF